MNNDRWEYHVKHSELPLSEAQLNELGAKGWELAAAMPTGGHYIFKRLNADEEDRIARDHRVTAGKPRKDAVPD